MSSVSLKEQRWIMLMLYGFGLFLLMEWLKPIGQLTDTGNILVFILFVILSLLLYYLGVHWFFRFLLLSSYILVAIQWFHSDLPFFHFTWISVLFDDFQANLSAVFKGHWEALTDSFRTLLFFTLLWLVTYLIHYWVNIKQSIFLLFLSTVIFISILDTFTPYDGDGAMIRIIAIGLVVFGLLSLMKIPARDGLTITGGILGKWTLLLSGMVMLSLVIGFGAPKFSAQWPDPVPFITSYSDKVTGEKSDAQKVGYDEDDSSLGGSIEPDSSVAFYTNASEGHYWKVETKSMYTGKGWVTLDGASDNLMFRNGEDMTSLKENERLAETIKTEEETSKITAIQPYPHILRPQSGYLKSVDIKKGATLNYLGNVDKIIPKDEAGSLISPKEYILSYDMPTYDLAELRKVREADEEMEAIMETYTQLPTGLPNRIIRLAESLAQEETNWYDQAKAIENYFDKPEFIYSKEDIPFPEENQDYVDQFLFETLKGYCDNFSTAMTVLLRAADIPARWVKGYTEGEQMLHEGDRVYKVTNDNAHSWVEVYFPGNGWIPFEPTKGFNGDFDSYNSALNTDDTDQTDQPEDTPKEEKAAASQPDKQEKEPEAIQSSRDSGSYSFWKPVAWGIGGLLLCSLILYYTRRKWLPLVHILRFKKRTGPHFSKAYVLLLKQLKRAGLRRPEGQTLREYAAYVDAVYETKNMSKMTSCYETLLYRGDPETDEWERFRPQWETLMKKTGS